MLSRIKLQNKAIIIFIIITIGMLFFLPNHTIDPWHLFNPRIFAILLLTIASIQFCGYLAIRLFGHYFGFAITGLIGGFISSTAVFANLPQALKSYPLHKKPILAAALFANVAMLIAMLIILLVASRTFFYIAFWPILSMIIVASIIAVFLLVSHKLANHFEQSTLPVFKFMSIIFTALFIGALLIAIAIIKRYIGTEGILLASFLSGLFEVHSITLATAILYVEKQINLQIASYALSLAVLASFISKIGLLWILTPRHFALESSLYLFAIILTGGLVYGITGI